MKFAKLALAAGISGAMILNSPATFAASQDECAIWLCLPAGFPSGCGGAKSAFIKRIKKFKPPLPDFMSCVVESPDSNLSYKHKYAAYVPTRQVCTDRFYGWGDDDECSQWKTIPAHHVKDRRCYDDDDSGYSDPAGCTRTDEYVDVYIDGKKTGDTFYWNRFNIR